jgi:hypothetical protein
VVVGADRARVAVHGTHLRVARSGDRVTIDLNEGVVSVGTPPRSGLTLGTLVTAPAHAEFSVKDPAGTLTVTHDQTGVRPPVSLRPAPPPRPAVVSVQGPSHHAEPAARSATAPSAGARAEPRLPSPPPVEAPSAAASAAAVPATPELPPIDPNANATVAAVVRSCIPVHATADGVTAAVSYTVNLDLNEDGTVHLVRFSPWVAPEVNTCATRSIFKVRFGHGGTAIVPVDITVPSSAP